MCVNRILSKRLEIRFQSHGSLDNLSLSDLSRAGLGTSSSGIDTEETEGIGITSPSW